MQKEKNETNPMAADETEVFENKAPAPRKINKNSILSINSTLHAETDKKKLNDAFMDLHESQKVEKLMSGILCGIEQYGNSIVGIVQHEKFKIMLPADHFTLLTEETDVDEIRRLQKLYMTARLGSEVDFVITKTDRINLLAAGNRIKAMRIRQRLFFKKKQDEYVIFEGRLAEARVVSVTRGGIFVELFGKELFVSSRELSYKRIQDATQIYQPGQRIVVKITKLERDELKKKITAIDVSVKQASPNPVIEGIKRYSIDSKYYGVVSMVDAHGVYVALDNDCECLCAYPKFGPRPICGTRVTVKITKFDYEALRIFGVISYMQPQF